MIGSLEPEVARRAKILVSGASRALADSGEDLGLRSVAKAPSLHPRLGCSARSAGRRTVTPLPNSPGFRPVANCLGTRSFTHHVLGRVDELPAPPCPAGLMPRRARPMMLPGNPARDDDPPRLPMKRHFVSGPIDPTEQSRDDLGKYKRSRVGHHGAA